MLTLIPIAGRGIARRPRQPRMRTSPRNSNVRQSEPRPVAVLRRVAAFLERASELTQDPVRRSQRALEAAQAKFRAGAFESATALLATAATGQPDELTRGRIDVLRAGIAFAQGRGKDAPPLLLAAARRLERRDVALARETYLEAVSAVIFAGHLARSPGWREVGEAARAAPPAQVPRAPDKLLDALAVRLTDGYAAFDAEDRAQSSGSSVTRMFPSRKGCAGSCWPGSSRRICGTSNAGGWSRPGT